MELDVGPEEPADAAAAFEALRREVALLNVAVAGLAAGRTPAPDYSETLGEIVKGVSVAVGRLGKLAASPALAMSPVEMARQISAAGDEARLQDRSALHQAREGVALAVSDLRSLINGARLSRSQNRRLIQTTLVGILVGGFLGGWLPGVVARAAPDQWAWPEKIAARTLRRDLWSAGERMLETADARKWEDLRNGAAIVAQKSTCPRQMRARIEAC